MQATSTGTIRRRLRPRIAAAQKSDKPTMIACKTTIGFGAPTKAGTSGSHGSPLGADEIKGAREKLGWTSPPFEIPAGHPELVARRRISAPRSAHKAWDERLAALPIEKRGEFARRINGDLPLGLDDAVRAFKEKLAAEPKEIATRIASQNALEALTAVVARNGRRFGRPHRLEQHPPEGHEGDVGRRLRRPLHPLRHPRARHGRRDERHGAASRRHPVFGHVPGVRRLLPPLDPARRADGRARDPRDDARLDRARRGRPDAPAGRASGGAARDPEPARVPPVRHGRDARVLAACARKQEWPERARADAAEPAATAQGDSTTRNLCAGGAYEIAPSIAGQARVSIFATGSEVAIAVEAKKLLDAQGVLTRVVSVPCFELFAAQMRRRAAPSSAMRVGQRRGRGRACVRAGTRSSARMACSSACTASAPAPRTRTFTAISASRPRRWPKRR